MKKLYFLVLLCLFLASCSKKGMDEVYFLHAIGFDGHEEGIKMSVLLEAEENQGEDDYFVSSFVGKDVNEALEKMLSEYKYCYSGTAKTYYFGETLSRTNLFDIARQITDSPFFSSQSKVVSVSIVTARGFLDNIKKREDLKSVNKITEHNKLSAVEFFALCTSTSTNVKTISLGFKDAFVREEDVYYRNCARVERAYFE